MNSMHSVAAIYILIRRILVLTLWLQIANRSDSDLLKRTTKAGGIEIRPLSEHQNRNLENVHITTATLIKFAQKIVC
jgi:hypothetical protein